MRKLLIPFNLIYRFAVFARNYLYKINFLKQTALDTYVISIGNISSGGTGKTPFTEYFAKYLMNNGKYVAVVSRGYKRVYDEIQVAEIGYKNENHELTLETFGDESLQMLINLAEIKIENPGARGLIVVSDDKTKGSKFVYRKFHPDIIIIDDAFQHRKLYRDLDIVLINNSRNRMMLPAGDLREPYRNLKRADFVIINKKFGDEFDPIEKERSGITVCNYFSCGFFDLKDNKINLKGKKIFSFCGIADPDSFRELLELEGLNVVRHLSFPDHHNFSNEDVDKILNGYETAGADCLVTTQKDYVRFRFAEPEKQKNLYHILLNTDLYYSRIELRITKNENKFLEKINKLLNL